MYVHSSIRQAPGGKRKVQMPAENDRQKVNGPGSTGAGNTMLPSKVRQGPMGKKRKVPSA